MIYHNAKYLAACTEKTGREMTTEETAKALDCLAHELRKELFDMDTARNNAHVCNTPQEDMRIDPIYTDNEGRSVEWDSLGMCFYIDKVRVSPEALIALVNMDGTQSLRFERSGDVCIVHTNQE